MMEEDAFVIGGGIGEAIAARLAAEGASAYLTERRQAEIAGVSSSIGHGAPSIVADASDPAIIDRAVAAVVADGGRIDALVFNAAVAQPADVLSSTSEHFDRHFALNARAPLLAMRRAVPHVPWVSAAAVVGSTASEMANTSYSTYAATKGALRSMVTALTTQVRVNKRVHLSRRYISLSVILNA